MLNKESYEKVKAIAESQGYTFWAFTAKALTAYIRAKTGEKVKLELTTPRAQSLKKAAEEEWTIVDMLIGSKPKLVREIIAELNVRGFALGRTSVENRLRSLAEKGLIHRKQVGTYFGKQVNQWAILDSKKAEQWLDENDPY